MAVRQNYYVYEHWRLDKDECFYVGKGCRNRAYATHRRGSHWDNIVNKLERIGSGYEVRLVKTGLTEKEAFSLERERIAFWRDIVDLANKTDGGEGVSGLKHTAETRAAMTLRRIGNQFAKGNRHTNEFKSRRSKALTGDSNPMRDPEIAAKAAATLRSHGENHSTKRIGVRAKISAERKGKLVGDENPSKRPEVRSKISAAQKGKPKLNLVGRKHSEKSIQLMREAALKRWAKRRETTGA